MTNVSEEIQLFLLGGILYFFGYFLVRTAAIICFLCAIYKFLCKQEETFPFKQKQGWKEFLHQRMTPLFTTVR